MDITAMQKEVYEWAYSKGWEPDPDRTFADECALLHSEVSEALEAYRTWKFEDATVTHLWTEEDKPIQNPKPEGVGSEFADVLVRLMHYSACGRFTFESKPVRYMQDEQDTSFGTAITQMHQVISKAWNSHRYANSTAVNHYMRRLLSLLLDSCELYGLDLEREYRRKMAYNLTRSYRHGNKVM